MTIEIVESVRYSDVKDADLMPVALHERTPALLARNKTAPATSSSAPDLFAGTLSNNELKMLPSSAT